MNKLFRSIGAVCALALLPLMQPAVAHPVGFGPNGVSLATSHPFDPAIPGWLVRDEATGGPIAITAVPDNRPWQKDLILPGVAGALIPFSTIYTVREQLIVGQPGFPGPAWTDWHEHILGELWDWVGGTILVGGVAVPGLHVSLGRPGLAPDLGHSPDIWFDFEPLLPGTRIDIVKQIHCHGPNGCPTNGVISIIEWPTIPEPGSMLLVAVALLAIGFAGRRRT